MMEYIDTLGYTSIPEYSYFYLCLNHAARVWNMASKSTFSSFYLTKIGSDKAFN